MDVWDRLQAGDMMKNAVIVASFVYDAANRDQMLPRKPLPKPQPASSRRTGRRRRRAEARRRTEQAELGLPDRLVSRPASSA